MRLVLEPAPLVPLSQRKGRFRKTAPISVLSTVLDVSGDLQTFIGLTLRLMTCSNLSSQCSVQRSWMKANKHY